MKALNENDPDDPLPFVTLAACTRNVLEYLSQQKKGAAEDGRADKNETESNDRENAKRDYIAERVAAIEKFERIASGKETLRRKRHY